MEEEFTRRDRLSQERTHFANERTLLAYFRTALSFLALGAFLVKFFFSTFSLVAAIASIIFGLGLFVYGTRKFFKFKKEINHQ